MKSAKTRNTKKTKRQAKRAGGMGPGHALSQSHYVVTLPYASAVGLTEAAAGAGATWSWSLNNAFDPDFTGTGNQPVGFDQFAQFYGRYRVLSMRYEVMFGNLATSPTWCGVYHANSSVLPATPAAWAVQPYGAKATLLSASGGGNDVHGFRSTVDIPATFGVTKPQYVDEADFAAVTTAGPARTAFLHTWIVGQAGTASSARSTVRLFYVIEFSQPVALSLS